MARRAPRRAHSRMRQWASSEAAPARQARSASRFNQRGKCSALPAAVLAAVHLEMERSTPRDRSARLERAAQMPELMRCQNGRREMLINGRHGAASDDSQQPARGPGGVFECVAVW